MSTTHHAFFDSRLLHRLGLHLGGCAHKKSGLPNSTHLQALASEWGSSAQPAAIFDGAACNRLQAPEMSLSAGIGLILGLNGAIWVSTQQHQTTAVPSGAAAAHEGLAQQQQKQATMLTKEERSRVVRVATCIRALARLYLLVYPATILETFQVIWVLIK